MRISRIAVVIEDYSMLVLYCRIPPPPNCHISLAPLTCVRPTPSLIHETSCFEVSLRKSHRVRQSCPWLWSWSYLRERAQSVAGWARPSRDNVPWTLTVPRCQPGHGLSLPRPTTAPGAVRPMTLRSYRHCRRPDSGTDAPPVVSCPGSGTDTFSRAVSTYAVLVVRRRTSSYRLHCCTAVMITKQI